MRTHASVGLLIVLVLTLTGSIRAYYIAPISEYVPTSEYLSHYTIQMIEKQFGSQSLSIERQNFIQSIAKKMKINRLIIVRKMNWRALQTYGYCNAFTLPLLLYNIIPVSNAYFLYVSDSFFEDLNDQEQLFLIAHELAHIKYGHVQWLSLVIVGFFVLLLGLAWLLYRILRNHNWLQTSRVCIAFWVITMICSGLVCECSEAFYRKYIEKVADETALRFFGCYQGCLSLLDRWVKEYRFPEHNRWYGLFASHPSMAERQELCLLLQNQDQLKGVPS